MLASRDPQMADAARTTSGEPPKTFDSFEVERPLGVGGMGHVYLGRDTMLDRLVALKFIASDSPSPEARKRFVIEARAIAKLAHPNVVGVFRIGEVESRPYIAYEHVDGRSLDSVTRPLTWGATLRIAALLARGLEAAHRAGIVHRDVKPSNVMLSSSGDVKLLDFGIAKLEPAAGSLRDESSMVPMPIDLALAATQAEGASKMTQRRAALTRPGSLIGTPAYLAPELWAGEPATPRSDVYAVGLLMFELVTGALPFAPLVGEQLADAVLTRDAPFVRSRRPEIPPAFATIIDTCLLRDPRARFETAAELRVELEKVKSVYLPHSDELDEVRLSDEARLVADSFARLLPRSDALVSGVYTKLFTIDPGVRALFPEDLGAQKMKLAHALKLAIEGLRDADRIADILRELGRRHGGYGVTPAHFETLGQALHATVRELDAESWNEELAHAWRQAYAFIATAMRQGLSAAGTTAMTHVEAQRVRTPASNGPSSTPRTPSHAPAPVTQYARNGNVSLAYQVFGRGPDLVVLLGAVTHLELAHAHPALGDFLQALAEHHRVIFFDKRGTGLSDRALDGATLGERSSDIGAVMDAAGSARAAILGIADGAALAASFAAANPERVSALVAWAPSPRLLNTSGYEGGIEPEALDGLRSAIRERWGEPVFAELVASSMADDRTFIQWLATYLRMSASPGNAAALLDANALLDVREILPKLAVPTLVMHRRGDRLVPLRSGRAFAELVPGARLIELDGEDHVPFTGSDVAPAILAHLANAASR